MLKKRRVKLFKYMCTEYMLVNETYYTHYFLN